MLYGNKEVQDEILNQVRKFEEKYDKKVVFGAMVGSISKGAERYDSDYDTRFLYLDKSEKGFVRWDKIKGVKEFQIHQCYIPGSRDCYVDGEQYRNNYYEFETGDKSLFYDKIAFWELTSYINFLNNPTLDNKFSIGLYHMVGWTFNSPFCWDPYGIKSKIACLLDEMFVREYEVQYYRNYILKAINKSPVLLREYLYSVYYGLSMNYSILNNRFSPVYFKSLLALCDDDELVETILGLEKRYYETADMASSEGVYRRKVANTLSTEKNSMIDCFLLEVLKRTEKYCNNNIEIGKKNYVDAIIDIIIDSLKRPVVKDVND